MDEDTKKLLSEVKEGVKAEVVEELKKELPVRKDIFGGDNHQTEEKEQKENAAKYIRALYAKDFATVKALSEGTSADGGYLVPTYLASEIVRVAGVYGVARRDSRIWPMVGAKQDVPSADSVTAYRVGEKSKITSSQPTFSKVSLQLQKLATLIPMSNDLLKDANQDVADLLARLSAEALAKKEDEWAFLGLSAGEGLFQDTNVNVVTLGSGDTTYAKADFDDLLDLMGQISEGALSGAKWYMSFSMFIALRKNKYASGTASYILQEPGAGVPASIWGYPVEFVSVMPRTSDGSQASKKFLAFGNLNYLLLGDARQYEIKISEEASVTDTDGSTNINLFEQDMSAVRVIERVDVKLAQAAKAFAVLKTAAT